MALRDCRIVSSAASMSEGRESDKWDWDCDCDCDCDCGWDLESESLLAPSGGPWIDDSEGDKLFRVE